MFKKKFVLVILALMFILVGCQSPTKDNNSNSYQQPVQSSTLDKVHTSLENQFVGSVNSDKYHYPDCRSAFKIKPENEVWFTSVEDAKSQGYVACKVCKPSQ